MWSQASTSLLQLYQQEAVVRPAPEWVELRQVQGEVGAGPVSPVEEAVEWVEQQGAEHRY